MGTFDEDKNFGKILDFPRSSSTLKGEHKARVLGCTPTKNGFRLRLELENGEQIFQDYNLRCNQRIQIKAQYEKFRQ